VEKRVEKPSKPLGFSKTVVTRYLAPEAAPARRSKPHRGAQPGRPTSRLLRRVDAGDDLAPVVAVGRQKSIRIDSACRQSRDWD
jgi:hypothetical protein